MKIGILGGGQLARMLSLAGYPLGCEVTFLSPESKSSAAPLGRQIRADYDDEGALTRLATWADVVTYEFENIPAFAPRLLTQSAAVRPGVEALALAQDRLLEKQLFASLEIPTVAYRRIDTETELQQAAQVLDCPAILKTRSQGYDGKGQVVLRRKEELAPAWRRLGGQPAILEKVVAFERELSIIAVRGLHGDIVFYPVSENIHRDGILRLATCRPSDPMQAQAEAYARKLLTRLDYVGVLTLELFQVGGRLLANEFAPRVHNSGHWTIEGAATSQFENHLRAITGLPLGATTPNGVAATINFVGALPPGAEILRHPETHLHVYGKDPRPGRKIGHATVRAESQRQLGGIVPSLLALAEASEAQLWRQHVHGQDALRCGRSPM